MNTVKLFAPDFAFGKALVMVRAFANLGAMLLLHPSARSLRLARLVLSVKPRYTMVTSRNLISLYNLVQRITALGLPGDIVECGVWNGGSAALMGASDMACGRGGGPRAIWLFDSFQGLPPPSDKDGEVEQKFYFEGLNKGAVDNVRRVFQKLGVSLGHVHIVPGWFNDTLMSSGVERIALLHIDADWYESVKTALDALYDRVVPGGFVVLDDYGYWEGCERALSDYFAEHGIRGVEIKRADRVGAYFQKLA